MTPNTPPAGRWQLLQFESPVDFGWHLLPTIRQAAASGDEDQGLEAAAQLGYLLGRIYSALEKNGHLRESPRIIAIPGDNEIQLAGLLLKFDNNGTTFLAAHDRFDAGALLPGVSFEPCGAVHVLPHELSLLL